MTIAEAIKTAQEIYPSAAAYPPETLVQWLDSVDHTWFKEVVMLHVNEDGLDYKSYTAEEQDTVLLIPEPYDDVYILFIMAKADLYNGELDRYNNSAILYSEAYKRAADAWNRTHKHLGPRRFIW